MRRQRARRVERFIAHDPQHLYFKPAGIPRVELETVELGIDEYEAIRLADIQGLSMQESAEQMRISAPTFNRTLKSAHQKVADAIVHGKAIKIFT